MQTVKAIYDGINVKLLEPAPVKEKCEVFITFIEPAKTIVRPPFECNHMSNDFDVPLEEFKDKTKTSSLSEKRPFSDLFGEWSGQIWMSDDFDAPLEEMKEYM
jgi:hypothetical protein